MPKAKSNGIELEYEIHGDPAAEPLLLVMGLGAQMTRWPPALYEMLVARGLRVIRFDNRDVGLSQKIDEAGMPDYPAILTALAAGQKPPVAYTLNEMAADTVGLLDTLGIRRAHIVGASMGGMISQLVAADYPDRVLSLTSIMSTTGNRALPQATPEALAVLTNRGPSPKEDREGFIAHSLNSARVIGSPGFPFEEQRLRDRIVMDLDRCYYPPGFARQYAAVMATPDRREKLKTITAPTIVLHGDADPLVNVAGGHDTHANIPGAELRIFPGMGHDIPQPLYGDIVDGIMRAVERARVTA